MTTQQITQTIAGLVSQSMVSKGFNKKSLADATGIPYSTLGRKLMGRADFTFPELYIIALALGVDPSGFTPAEFDSHRLSA